MFTLNTGILLEMFTDKVYQCDSETASHSSFQAVLKPVQHTVSLDAHSVDTLKTLDSNFIYYNHFNSR